MITQVDIQNFKCFSNLRIETAALTLLTGLNGGGKSTSIQPLLLLSQASRQNSNPIGLSLNGPLVHLGSAGDVVLSKGGPEFTVSAEQDKVTWRFVAKAGERSLLVSRATAPGPLAQGIEWDRSVWPPSIGPADDASEIHAVRRSLMKLAYIAATRSGSPDVYPYPDYGGEIVGDVGSDGQFAPYWYDRLVDEDVTVLDRKSSPTTLRKRLDEHLSLLFPNAQANVTAIPQSSALALRFRIGGSSEWRRPANIGFGLTYAFPILVSLLTTPPGQTVVIDSPEAHLHPSAQSAMGQIISEAAARHIQVIVETHSDHLLNGVRIAIQNQVISHQEVAIHFFRGAEGEHHGVTSPKLDAEGNVSEWPAGFFDQSERDLARLSGWS